MNRVSAPPIGVFDSGLGGLSVLKALREALPAQDFIYIADSGHAPYGERDEAHVIARSAAITAHLADSGIQALVVACNTATAAAIHLLRAAHPTLPIVGVEPALRPAAACTRTGHIGVLATRGTLASARFQALRAAVPQAVRMTVQACDGLASAIERQLHQADTTELIAICDDYIRAIGHFGHEKEAIDTLVLGCTHYPFASEQLAGLLPAGIQLVATGEAVARQTRRVMEGIRPAGADTGFAPRQGATGRTSLFTTGQPPSLQLAAQRWLGLNCEARYLNIPCATPKAIFQAK